ncbi:hypothetical protein CERSUDRAFT_77817 [Gelatoporia subvermispora B]|uniref:Uncharacterized protein n=1 Tax=Ceriporiopsis subvermispora (strain B) TaxID=914234 RepID=M2P996_CERS8|nr:hypothetical protein CERSUDRAFT_77817 [Gelatoporia subvermispora B]
MAGAAKSQTVSDGIRSLAFYTEAIRADNLADIVAESIDFKLIPLVDQFNEVIYKFNEIENMGEKLLCDTNDTVNSLKAERERLALELLKAVESAAANRNRQPDDGNITVSPVTAVTSKSYATALRAAVPQSHEMVLVWQSVKGHQVLELNEQELLQKARLALESTNTDTPAPPRMDFVAVKRLRNSGVLYKLTSVQAAKWLRGPEVMKAFALVLGSDSMVKAQTFAVLAEFVPIIFRANSPASWSEVETRNNLDIDDVKDGR